MTLLHPRIDGIWARQIGPFGEVEIEHAWPHGNESASWAFLPGTSHRVLRAGAPVSIYAGGVRVWRGRLQEPGTDGQITASGLWTEALDSRAMNAAGIPTSWVHDAVDEAITRGALSWGDHSVLPETPAVAGDTGYEPMMVNDVLDLWADQTGQRWGLDPDGNVLLYADANAPRLWVVPYAAAGRGLTVADDDFATDLYGKYQDTSTSTAYVTVTDLAARAQYGRLVEREVDLTPLGVITSAEATTALQNALALAVTRLRFTEGLDLMAGQILTSGGAPAPLPLVRAGHVVRLLGVRDVRTVFGLRNYTDVLIGKSTYNSDDRTLSITPVDPASRGLRGALES